MKASKRRKLELVHEEKPQSKKTPTPPLSLLSAEFVYMSAAGTTPEYLRAKFASIRKQMAEAQSKASA